MKTYRIETSVFPKYQRFLLNQFTASNVVYKDIAAGVLFVAKSKGYMHINCAI